MKKFNEWIIRYRVISGLLIAAVYFLSCDVGSTWRHARIAEEIGEDYRELRDSLKQVVSDIDMQLIDDRHENDLYQCRKNGLIDTQEAIWVDSLLMINNALIVQKQKLRDKYQTAIGVFSVISYDKSYERGVLSSLAINLIICLVCCFVAIVLFAVNQQVQSEETKT